MNILIFGATGMLGHAIFEYFSMNTSFMIFGTTRWGFNSDFKGEKATRIIFNVNYKSLDSIVKAFEVSQPNLVINCIGLIKQLSAADDPLEAIPVNSLFPHQLSKLCELFNSRLIHFSTDCVFSGKLGDYRENYVPDAQDLYGRSKLLGEVYHLNTVTLRTSIIGPELHSKNGLLEWFLSQEGECKGYTKAIFSGLPTVEVARILCEHIIPNIHLLRGMYHLSAPPISKFNLLSLISDVYKKSILIIPDDKVVIDKSLNSSLISSITGFESKDWPCMIQVMKEGF